MSGREPSLIGQRDGPDDAASQDAPGRFGPFGGRYVPETLMHAIAYAVDLAPTLPRDTTLVINLSGRGDKNVVEAARLLGQPTD